MTDPKKTDFIVNKFLKTRQNIQQIVYQNVYATWAHNTNFQSSWNQSRTCKNKLKEGLAIELKPIREGVKNLPKTITFQQFPSITAYDDDGGEEEDVFIRDIAEQYLRKFASTSGTDKTFGLRDKDGKIYIGNKETKRKENNIIVGDKEYAGTPELWELIVATTLDDKISPMGIMIIMLK